MFLTSACDDKQHVRAYICNRFHARRANSGKIDFSEKYLSLTLSFKSNLLTQEPVRLFVTEKLEFSGAYSGFQVNGVK